MDTTTLLIIVVVVVVAALIISRNRSRAGSAPYTRTTGTERPTYDDPGYTSTGSIGGSEVVTPVPQERSVGGGTTGTNERSHDDPNYRSGGSIGGA